MPVAIARRGPDMKWFALRNLWDGIDTYAAVLAELRW
jgi:hypothetical protein